MEQSDLMPPRKLKVLTMDIRLFVDLFSIGMKYPYKVIEDALPQDTEVIECRMKIENHAVEFLLYSEDFIEIPDTTNPPDITPILQQYEMTTGGKPLDKGNDSKK